MEAGTQFIGIKPEINMAERKSNVANNPTDVFTIEEIANVSRPYKVYTALLTQSGGDAPQSISTGTLTEGVSYYFVDFNEPEEPWDFSNVGGPIYPNTDSFVANKTSEPNSYGSANIGYNTGAPVVTVLENTIGNVYWEYLDIGTYNSISNGNFTINKTFILVSVESGLTWQVSPSPYGDGDKIYFEAGTSGDYTDGATFQVEIRVYPEPEAQ